MKKYYELQSSEIIDNDDEFIEYASSVIVAIIDAEIAVSNGISFSDEMIEIISKQIEKKQMMVKKLEAIIEKKETLNNLNRNTLASLKELRSQINNISKNKEDKKHSFQKNDSFNEMPGFISDIPEKTDSMDTQQLDENTFVFEGKTYPATPKMKTVLVELWTTAKELSEMIPKTKGYICKTLMRLKDKGYPIISYTSSGKRYWMLEKGHKNTASENLDSKPELLLHALRQYKELNGRPPTATEISNLLKWDVFYVKNELKSLHLSGKIKMEKIVINWKTIKVWTVEEK